MGNAWLGKTPPINLDHLPNRVIVHTGNVFQSCLICYIDLLHVAAQKFQKRSCSSGTPL